MEQRDLFTARAEGEASAQRCADKAESHGWNMAAAAELIVAYLRQHGPTPGEVLVSEARKAYPPHDDRAFGAVFARLSRAGRIVKAGFALRTKGHGTAGGIVWAVSPSPVSTPPG